VTVNDPVFDGSPAEGSVELTRTVGADKLVIVTVAELDAPIV
jgi:hypothetical protein